jgi:hypothetical protein
MESYNQSVKEKSAEVWRETKGRNDRAEEDVILGIRGLFPEKYSL